VPAFSVLADRPIQSMDVTGLAKASVKRAVDGQPLMPGKLWRVIPVCCALMLGDGHGKLPSSAARRNGQSVRRGSMSICAFGCMDIASALDGAGFHWSGLPAEA